jgi:hypothetical protein
MARDGGPPLLKGSLMSTIRLFALSARCIIAARPRPAECVRMIALAALAAVALREESKCSRMWLGQMRGAFRRAMAAKMAAETAIPACPWMDLLGQNAVAVSALAGIVAGLVAFLSARG